MSQELRRSDDDTFTRRVRAIRDLVATVGVPAVALGFVLWMFNTGLKENTASVIAIQNTISIGFKEIHEALKEQNRIMRRRSYAPDMAEGPKNNG